MKNFPSKSLRSLLAATCMAWCASSYAQVVVTEVTPTYAGTVTQYEPVNQTLIVRQDAASAPMTYAVTKATTIVDENGTPVLAEHITTGVPITVHYVRQGDQMIASRVILRRPASVSVERVPVPAPAPAPVPVTTETTERKTTVTTTTGAGTITQFAPGSPNLILRSETGTQPLTYGVSRTTTFVDENGTPIAVERIAPGLPVTVHYVQEGDQLIASRVVVVRQPTRKLSEDEKEALEDLREAQKDLREAQRERKEDLREKRNDKDD